MSLLLTISQAMELPTSSMSPPATGTANPASPAAVRSPYCGAGPVLSQPLHIGDSGCGRRSCCDTLLSWTFHRVRTNQCRVRQAPQRHSRYSAQAREQSYACGHPNYPRFAISSPLQRNQGVNECEDCRGEELAVVPWPDASASSTTAFAGCESQYRLWQDRVREGHK